MNKKKIITISFFSLFVLSVISSCTTDFEVNAPYKELTSVYGLLDQTKKEQFIRINRSFLGEGDALTMAKYQDSINYKAGDLEVKLERIKGGVVQPNDSETLQRVSVGKEAGTFASDSNFAYKGTKPLFSDSEYKLTIVNKRTNKTLTSTTPLIQDVIIKSPQANADPIICPACGSSTLAFRKSNDAGYQDLGVEWTTGKNAKLFEVILRFHYTERDPQTGNVVKKDSLDWLVNQVSSTNASSQKYVIPGEEFYRTIQSRIQESSAVKRFVKDVYIDIIINAGGEELNMYMDVTRPSSGIVQEKPEYTNIENGIGIFSCRYTTIRKDKKLSADSEKHLINGEYTGRLFD